MLARWLIALPLALAGCSGCGSDADKGAPAPASSTGQREVVSLIDALRTCDIDHRGLLIDLGSDALVGRFRNRLDTPVGGASAKPTSGLEATQHDGATWSRIRERDLHLSFFLPKVAPVFVAARAIGRASDRVSISIDGSLLGTVKLGRDEIRTATTSVTTLPVDAGNHTLTLHFHGRAKAESDPFAELDWIRIGSPDELERTYGAPTLQDILAPAAELAGVPHRAVALRAPGVIRCPLRVPPNGTLRVSVGMRGAGTATAHIALVTDQKEKIIERTQVNGGGDARWTDLEIPLGDQASQIALLELRAERTTGTGRLLFGDPTLLVPAREAPRTPAARAAIVVVLNGVHKTDLPPWRETETPHLRTLNRLVRDATVFDDHRAPSTLVAATMASLMSGLPPHNHTLSDSGARLPASVHTLAGVARDGSVPAAMFSSVPTSFAAFGFSSGWDKFEIYPPNTGKPATGPFDDGAAWLSAAQDEEKPERPMLAVLHARGGHPPWDVTPEEAGKLPPTDYTGMLGPRRAAQVLGKLGGIAGRLTEADRERLDGLYHAGLSSQDRALGKLIDALEEAGRWEPSLLIVTGDVASSRQTLFTDGADLDEDLLDVPLYVHFPSGAHAGERIKRPTEIYDITHTALVSLGLKPLPDSRGRDLLAVAEGVDDATELLRIAHVQDQFSARWGDFVLLGRADRMPKLCLLPVDPTCAVDRSDLHPIVSAALQRRLALMFEPTRRERPAREPLTVDPDTAAMLKVWGAL